MGNVAQLVGQNSKQLSDSTQYTYCSKTYHVMTSCVYVHNDLIHKYTLSNGSAGAVTGCGKFLAKYSGHFSKQRQHRPGTWPHSDSSLSACINTENVGRLTFTHNSHIFTVSAVMYTSQEMMTLSDDALIPNASQFTEQDGAAACTEPCRSKCS